MNKLVLSSFLLCSMFVGAVLGQHFGGDNFGDSDFDSDWFWIGSNLRSIGRPKLKITEHPDGYSMQMGYTGKYIRFRYTYSDHSLDFNIMDYKGSFNFRKEPNLEGTFTLNGEDNVDATIQVKHSESGPDGVQNFEISFVNLFSGKGGRLYMPDTRIREAEKLEAVIKVKINPSNFAESTMSFNLNARGKIYNYISGNDWDSNWFPGNYNMTASVQAISVQTPNPRQRQPKMTAALDLEEEVIFDNDKIENLPRSEKLLKKSLLIDCMINLTGKGSRLAVMKVTDAESDKTIGRIQAKREDEETMKLEFFMHGQQLASLNFFQNEGGVTNVTMEDLQDPECSIDYDSISNDETSFNQTSNLNDTRPANQTFDDKIENDSWNRCKTVSRFLESFSGDGVYESRIYKDIFLIFDPPGYRKRATAGEKSLIFEETLMMKDDIYDGTVMFGGYERSIMHCKLNNSGDGSMMEMEMKNEYLDWQNDEYRPTGQQEKINMDITPSDKEEDDFNMKLSYNDDRIFDGWFYLTRLIQRYAKQEIPAMIERTLDGFKETHAQTTQQLSEFF